MKSSWSTRLGSLVRALQDPSFALLWSGNSTSRLGDHFHRIALTWWVLEKTGSATVLGTALICSTVPMLLFSLAGGALVDRWPRLPVLFISDAARAVIVGWMAALAFADRLEVWEIYVFSALFGFVDAFFQPAYRAALPEMLKADQLSSANSLNSLTAELSGILGPLLAAIVVAASGTAYAFAFNALSFFISAGCLALILRRSPKRLAAHASPGILQDIRQGLRAVFEAPWLWITIGIAGISNLTYAGPMGVALPFLIEARFHGDVRILGYVYTCMSAGALLGAAWLGTSIRLRRRGIKLYGVWMVIGLMVASMAAPLPVYFLLAAALVIGAANTLLGLIWLNTLQELVPTELQGRVSSIDYLGSSVLEPAGYAAGGWATAAWGPIGVMLIGGTLQTALIALGLLHPKVRNLD